MKRAFSLIGKGLYAFGRGLGFAGRVTVALVGIAGVTVATADYLMTIPGSGTTFASVVISTKHYAAMVLCDAVVGETQCQTITAAGAAKVDGSAVTQPVSGTVTANAGTNLNTSALSTSANQTNGTQQTKVTDGTNVAAVKAASTAPFATDPAVVVTESPNSPLLGPSTAIAGTTPTTQTPVSSGSTSKIQTDVNGNLYIAPSQVATAGTHAQTAALASSLIIKASAGSLIDFQVSADSTLSAASWALMIFDATTAPADGPVTPAKCYIVPSGTTSYSGAFVVPGAAFTTGITAVASSTGCFTKTASAHAFIAADFQ
jgi:hypothetical protein